MKKNFYQIALIAAMTAISLTSGAQAWKLLGNAGTDPKKNFVGTTDLETLVFRTNDSERVRISGINGLVGIGTKSPKSKLSVDGGVPVNLTSAGYAIVGSPSTSNLVMDYQQIQARYNGGASTLFLNYNGGNTYIGNSSTSSYGAICEGSAYGVYGYASSGIGVYGYGSTYGSYNYGSTYGSYSTGGTGAFNDGSGTYGLEAHSSGNGVAVYGHADNWMGLYGGDYVNSHFVGTFGGSKTSYGVWGYSDSSYGLYASTNYGSYAGYFSGSVFTTGTYSSSDQKLKENIKDMTTAMDIINQLRPKQYTFRQDGNYKLMNLPQGEHYGLIAQDVEKVLPNLVKDSRFNVSSATPPSPTSSLSAKTSSEVVDFKALNYTELIPILIKAMQEQQQQIDQLKQTVQNLSANKSVASNTASTSAGALQQNTPNPFTQNTTIRCNLPSSVQHAQLVVYSNDGKPIKTYDLNNKGYNEVTINAGSLSAGQYVYTLIADGKSIDTKYMVLTK